jgi:hypothetical protein
MSPLNKIPESGSGYHAAGELIVAPDRSLSNPITNLKRLVIACGDPAVFYHHTSLQVRHFSLLHHQLGPKMTNFQDPNYVKVLLKDLNRVRLLLKSSFPGQTVVDGMELICGVGFNLEKAESAARVALFTLRATPLQRWPSTCLRPPWLRLARLQPPSGKKRKRNDSKTGSDNSGGNRVV